MEKDFLADLMISKVHSIYHMYNAEGTKSRRINRPGWAVLLKYTGETTYRCNGEHIISNAGQMVILPKGCSYDWECTVSGHYYSIEFDWEQTCEHIFSFPINNCEKFLKIYKDLEYKRTLKDPFYELECIKGTYDIILKLLNSGGKPYAPASKQQKIQPAVDYIIQNYKIILPIPFITEIVNLICKFRQILIGSAFIMLNNNKESASCCNKSFEYRIRLTCSCLLRLTDWCRFNHAAVIQKIITCTAVWCNCIISIFISQTF